MKSHHTPGHWLANDGTVFSNGGHIIASLVSGRYHPDMDARIKERQANELLLAASPQLLTCLLQILADHMNGKELRHDWILDQIRMASPELADEYLRSLEARSA